MHEAAAKKTLIMWIDWQCTVRFVSNEPWFRSQFIIKMYISACNMKIKYQSHLVKVVMLHYVLTICWPLSYIVSRRQLNSQASFVECVENEQQTRTTTATTTTIAYSLEVNSETCETLNLSLALWIRNWFLYFIDGFTFGWSERLTERISFCVSC